MRAEISTYEVQPIMDGEILQNPNLHDACLLRLSLEDKRITLEFRTSEHLVEVHAINVLTVELLGMPNQMIVGQVQIWYDAPMEIFHNKIMTGPMIEEFVNDPIHDFKSLTENNRGISILKVVGIVGVQITISSESIKFYKSDCETRIEEDGGSDPRARDILSFIDNLLITNPDIEHLDKKDLASKIASEFTNWPKAE